MKFAVNILLFILAVTLAGCSDEPSVNESLFIHPPAISNIEPLVIEGATVVDVRTGELLEGLSVRISGGRIDQILPADQISVAEGVQRIDATGQFLVPGYMDMHAHPLGLENPEQAFGLMLANGITGFRQMSGDEELLALRRQGHLSAVAHPELLIMPGYVLVPQIAKSVEHVRDTVRNQQQAGADFIKAVAMQRDVYLAAMEEAAYHGLPFAGHLPADIDVRSAIAHGMQAIEHLGPGSSLFLSCSTEEEQIRQELTITPPSLPPVLPDFIASLMSPIIDRIVKRTLANPLLAEDERAYDLMQRMVDTFDEEKCQQLAQDVAASPLWQVPTLIRLRAMEYGDDEAFRKDEKLSYMPPATRELWAKVAEDFQSTITPDHRQTLIDFYALQERLVNIFTQADVKMLAGSDLGGQWLVPGFSLHQEFELLAQAGVPPLKVLQMTTINAAKFLGREHELGSVTAGLNANLVLLASNPLESVGNLQDIEGVVRSGYYHDAEALQVMKAR